MKSITKLLIYLLTFLELFIGFSDVSTLINDALKNSNTENQYSHYYKNKSVKPLNKLNTLSENKTYDLSTLSTLDNIENFDSKSLDHIFLGFINNKGNVVGYHYEGFSDSSASILPNTKYFCNNHGVYCAKVSISGIEKISNNGISSFFPKSWTPQDVIDSINQAYHSRIFIKDNKYIGFSNSGLKIEMYLNSKNLILTAYPKIYNLTNETVQSNINI